MDRGGQHEVGQQPAASFEPLGTEVFIVKVLGHLLEILHVGAEREKGTEGRLRVGAARREKHQ